MPDTVVIGAWPEYIGYNPELGNLAYSGELSKIVATNGEVDTLLKGESVSLVLDTTLKWKRTIATTEATCNKTLGIVIADIAIGGSCVQNILLYGYYRNDTVFTLTAGGLLYLATTAGDLTQTAPSATSQTVRIVGQAIKASTIRLNPDNTWIVLV